MNRFDDGEVIGETPGEVVVHGVRTDIRVKLSPGVMAGTGAPAERVLMALEGIRGTHDATVLSVSLRLPADVSSDQDQEFRAGSLGLYGLRRASAGSGQGRRAILDATPFFRALTPTSASLVDEIIVSIQLRRELPPGETIVIGRVVLFRPR
jgi:hypothetical protein